MSRACLALLLACTACAADEAPPRVVAVAAGNAHSCLLEEAGRVRCWGGNYFGQIGDGTTEDRLRPVVVQELPPHVVQLAAGADFTCALTGDGAVYCWGKNHRGQLGTDELDAHALPTVVPGLPPADRIAVGGHHACARAVDRVWCWGWNGAGQLADGTTVDHAVPLRIEEPDVDYLAAGYASTCVGRRGDVRCWGPGDALPPAGQRGALRMASGVDHACVLFESGELRCWGSEPGGLGHSLSESGRVEPVFGAVDVAAMADHLCVLTAGGAVHCWGRNDHGQLGTGDYVWHRSAVVADEVPSSRYLALGLRHSCAVTVDGAARCWGSNEFGQLGDGTRIDSLVPVSSD